MCFSVKQIDDLQSSDKKKSWTFYLPWVHLKIMSDSPKEQVFKKSDVVCFNCRVVSKVCTLTNPHCM